MFEVEQAAVFVTHVSYSEMNRSSVAGCGKHELCHYSWYVHFWFILCLFLLDSLIFDLAVTTVTFNYFLMFNVMARTVAFGNITLGCLLEEVRDIVLSFELLEGTI